MQNKQGCLYLFLRFLKPFFHGPENNPEVLPYSAKGPLLTKAEKSFYKVLCLACGDDLTVFVQVRVSELLSVNKSKEKGFHAKWMNKIDRKSIDFVICDPESLSVILAIELDDKSHEKPHRVKRDAFILKAFEAAGINLLRQKVKAKYSPQEIRGMIERCRTG